MEAPNVLAVMLLGLTGLLLLGTGGEWLKVSKGDESRGNAAIFTALSCWALGLTLLWLAFLYLP